MTGVSVKIPSNPEPAELVLREAELSDEPALADLIVRSLQQLGQDDYSHQQLVLAGQKMTGVDRQLIRDRSLYVMEGPDGALVACGGWSRRAQLYGPASAGGEGEPLDPATGAARLRAFFVDPGWARRGLGRRLLLACEQAAWDAGFRRIELAATYMGSRLYASRGYVVTAPLVADLAPGFSIEGLHMAKELGERPVD